MGVTSPNMGHDARSDHARGGVVGPARHVALIMDGNGRWASARALPRVLGHRAGVNALKRTVEAAPDLGIEWMTVFGFSTENWSRPATEVSELMGLLKNYVRGDLDRMEREGVRLRVIGRRSDLAPDVLEIIEHAEARTRGNTRFHLQVAFNYGARADIAEAARRYAQAVAAGEVSTGVADEAAFERYLSTAHGPTPDLIIRTSGERRLSNFLLWEAAYAELVFQDVLWPDYGKEHLAAALKEFLAGSGVLAEPRPMAPLPPVRRFDWKNLGVRAGSAAVLAPAAIAAVWFGDRGTFGGPFFLVLIAVAVALLTIEWGGMADNETPVRAAVVMAVAILIAVFAAYLGHPVYGWALVALGAATGAVFTLVRGKIDRPADIAFGILYIGAPAVALVWMRVGPGGREWTILLLAVVWAADIFAFLVGNLLKGPKLWPRFSPNKTWTGFVGGLIGGSIAAALVTLLPLGGKGPSFRAALLIGFLTALAAMAGDLWESMLKRRFGVKDSGDLIPGHGGLLDRVDGLMFAAVLVAAARLAAHLKMFA